MSGKGGQEKDGPIFNERERSSCPLLEGKKATLAEKARRGGAG